MSKTTEPSYSQSAPVDPTHFSLNDYEERQCLSSPVVPLKKSELWAWYIQQATSGAYGYISGVLLIPLLIQDMASMAGVQASDHTIPCNTHVPNFQCVTPLLGKYLEPGTISLYVSSLSSALCFFTSLSISAIADHGSYRKKLLIAFSTLGCISACLFFVIQKPSLFWVGIILSVLGWTFFNICGVCSHSYLPIYGRAHPDVLEAEARGESLLVVRKVAEQKVNDISAYSIAIGNIGTLVVKGIIIGFSLKMHENSLSLQIAIAFTGVWWFLWTLIIAPWLDARPNDPLPKGTNWVLFSWKTTYKTLASCRKMPEISKYMVSWFILSDGIHTVMSTLFIVLYRELSFTHVQSLLVSIVVASMGAIGAYLFMVIRKCWSISTKTLILLILGLYSILLSYIVIVPYFTTKVGLKSATEGWVCTVYIGLTMSTFHSSTRVLLAELCPEGDENEWFSFFLLADKGSSWIGPLVAGAIFTVTNDYRKAFWFCLGMIALGALVLLKVDVGRGKDQAHQFVKDKRELKEQKQKQCSSS